MPPAKWIAFAITTWVCLAVLGEISEGYYFGAHGEIGVLNTFMNLPVFQGGNPLITIPATAFSGAFWSALGNVLMFNFTMFEGEWAIIKYVLLYPLSITVMVFLVVKGFSLLRGGG